MGIMLHCIKNDEQNLTLRRVCVTWRENMPEAVIVRCENIKIDAGYSRDRFFMLQCRCEWRDLLPNCEAIAAFAFAG
jgi:hypothetical protein